jgi:hypothetical protein
MGSRKTEKKMDKKEWHKQNKQNKTKKVGGEITVALASVFTACMSVLQFIYYITAINKNTQPTGPQMLMISHTDIKHLANSYPEEAPPLVLEQDIKEMKKKNPKGMKTAIDKKYLKKIKRKSTEGETVEGYTLSAKGKKLIIDNVEKLAQ